MSFPVSVSDVPLVFGTLPVLKARYWTAAQSGDKIYTLARLYFLQGGLQLALYAFERTPSPGSRVTFVLAGTGGRGVQLELGPAAARYTLREFTAAQPLAAGGWQPLAQPPGFFSGVDEQGWYWGAQLALPPETVRAAGCDTAPQSRFAAAVLKHNNESNALGASFKIQDPQLPLDAGRFDDMVAVDY